MQQGTIGKHTCTGAWLCQEYFPVDVVTAGLMDIYQRLLGLRFKQVAGEVWHEDVQLWQVEDVATSENLGTMFRAFLQRCGSGMVKNPDPALAVNILNHISKSLSNKYFVKNA
jgi:hypothetical protein